MEKRVFVIKGKAKDVFAAIGCPYPQYITDEVSGVTVPSQRFQDWMAGWNRGYKDGNEAMLKTISKLTG